MTPEDINEIVAAIDRNTAQVKEVAVSGLVRNLILWFLAIMVANYTACPRAHATPLLPPLAQPIIVEIGTPPLPPPNPHLQYWHTQYVPGPDGVLPIEVFAPRLMAQVASEQVEVDVPEPGTGLMVTAGILALICFGSVFYQQASEIRKLKSEIYRRDAYIGRCRYALRQIQLRIADESELREIARKALEE